MFTHGATSITLDDGEVCLNSMQCKNKSCINFTNLGLNYCMPKVDAGEECSPSSVYGVLYRANCARGLTCEGGTNSYGRCSTGDKNTDITYIETSSNGYRKFSYIENGTTKYMYRCADGYYGIAKNQIVNTPTGCKKCPDGGMCYAPYNEVFFCTIGYYRNGDQCSRCPSVGKNSSGNPVYGTTASGLKDKTAEACSVGSGTYTDTNGTFELSETCEYTL